jgi:O-antigen/teichoic acid export membrane protein
MVISVLVTLIVPRLIGVKEYGYWQLYLFYSSYVGFLHFGWNDGIYLRYGGQEYRDLDKRVFFSQFYMLFILQITIATFIMITSMVFVKDENRVFILQMTSLCLVLTNIRIMLLYILQCTNRIKEYARITILDRVIYCSLVIIFLIVGIREYKSMIVADLIGRFISLLYAMNDCRDIVFSRICDFYFSYKEMIENVSVGIKLMFANIASMLIIGVVRFGIERAWDVSTFGKVSLTLSISNFMMIFINAVGIVIFPVLKRTDEKYFSNIYVIMRNCLMVVLFAAFIIYYPLRLLLSAWLPKYADSLKYMALLFPMCIYEGNMALLINTYLKALRKEKMMLKINFISMALSILFTLITTKILVNLDFAIASIVILLAFRSLLAEAYLSKILQIRLLKDIFLELVLTLTFIVSGWFINSWYTVIIYGSVYLIYLFIKKNDISNTIYNIKSLVKS